VAVSLFVIRVLAVGRPGTSCDWLLRSGYLHFMDFRAAADSHNAKILDHRRYNQRYVATRSLWCFFVACYWQELQ
jgi:hypothetical protein